MMLWHAFMFLEVRFFPSFLFFLLGGLSIRRRHRWTIQWTIR
jgi:hypothetical protein